MIDFISNSFRTIVAISAWLAAVAIVIAGIGAMVTTGFVAGLLAFAGLAIVAIMLYGTICLLIQNNDLLKRIAAKGEPAE